VAGCWALLQRELGWAGRAASGEPRRIRAVGAGTPRPAFISTTAKRLRWLVIKLQRPLAPIPATSILLPRSGDAAGSSFWGQVAKPCALAEACAALGRRRHSRELSGSCYALLLERTDPLGGAARPGRLLPPGRTARAALKLHVPLLHPAPKCFAAFGVLKRARPFPGREESF